MRQLKFDFIIKSIVHNCGNNILVVMVKLIKYYFPLKQVKSGLNYPPIPWRKQVIK